MIKNIQISKFGRKRARNDFEDFWGVESNYVHFVIQIQIYSTKQKSGEGYFHSKLH